MMEFSDGVLEAQKANVRNNENHHIPPEDGTGSRHLHIYPTSFMAFYTTSNACVCGIRTTTV